MERALLAMGASIAPSAGLLYRRPFPAWKATVYRRAGGALGPLERAGDKITKGSPAAQVLRERSATCARDPEAPVVSPTIRPDASCGSPGEPVGGAARPTGHAAMLIALARKRLQGGAAPRKHEEGPAADEAENRPHDST